MSNYAIKVENLSKSYQLRHQSGHQYTALRDVLAHKLKGFGQRVLGRPPQTAAAREEFWALKEVSFEIAPGERVGIIGRNGAGKSTLLKILSRITEPTAGRIRLRGRVASLLEVGTGFHPELTGRENIYLNGAILGMTRTEIKRKFAEIVAFAEVERFLDTPVKRYSSGMYVRLAFAVAAHLEPEILLVDEVLAVGDIEFQKKCLGKMEDVTSAGRTVLFVSHNMTAISRLCRKVLWIDKGQLVRTGDALNVIQAYEQAMIGALDTDALISKRDDEQSQKANFYVKSVEIFNTFGDSTNQIKYGDGLRLILHVSGKDVEGFFSPEFYVYNELGILVAVGASAPYHGEHFSQTVSQVQVELGPLWLTSGQYRISLSVMGTAKRLDTWENAIGFTITECMPFEKPWDIPAHREGVCVIQHRFRALT